MSKTKSKLWVDNPVTLKGLGKVEIPPMTETYCPVPYVDYVQKIKAYGDDFLKDFYLAEEKYGLARRGGMMFGLHNYKAVSTLTETPYSDELNLSVGFRTSYNKFLSNSMVIGTEVKVCSNLMLTGDIVFMRKHTKNVMDDLDDLFGNAFKDATKNYGSSIRQKEILKRISVTDTKAWEFLGVAVGKKYLGTRQLKVALKEWEDPMYTSHKKGTAWCLYNACTEALKSAPIHTYLEKHRLIQILFEINFKELWETRELLY